MTIPLTLAAASLTEAQIDALADVWHPKDGFHRPLRPIPHDQLLATQDFLYQDRVKFFRDAIEMGMFPPPADGLRLPCGRVVLVEGHHRTCAWLEVGFPAPVFVQEPDEA